MKDNVIVSGMRPTGNLHLGNYFGALKNWIDLQIENRCFFFIADWHALTTGYEDTSELRRNVYGLAADWISSGLDPDECVIFCQSAVKEHAELFALLGMVTPFSWLERCPTYKAQQEQLKGRYITTYGFLGYPCLQAADILLYKADGVPVGEDQLPHIELTREIGRRFNHLYGEIFPEPKSLLTKNKLVPGLDGRKMSKSYDNTIAISDDPGTVKQKVMQMITDPLKIRKDDPGHPGVCSVFAMHKLFNGEEIPEIEEDCEKGCMGCVSCKKNLLVKMQETLTPVYEKRVQLMEDTGYLSEIIDFGNEKARKVAEKTMYDVRTAMKI